MPRSSFIAWAGPSELDGGPVAVFMVPRSGNDKTGKMWQAHILRSDMNPSEAIATGADASICGGCRHRGIIAEDGTRTRRSCYVVYAQGPQSTWRANQGSPVLPIGEVLELLRGADLRIGAYGDPAAVPLDFWQSIIRVLHSWTSYTHQWPDLSDAWRAFCMASVDSLEEAQRAWDKGWRTYRIVTVRGPLVEGREIVCPFETRGVQCIDCGLCDGRRPGLKQPKSITIDPHGSGAKYLI